MGNVESNLWNENKCSLYNKISKTYIIPTRTRVVFFSQFINKKIKPTLNLIVHCIVSLKRNFTHRIPGRVKIGQIEVPKPGILHLTQQR